MKLADWLDAHWIGTPDPSGKLPEGQLRRRYHFAEEIGVTPSMVTDYCVGKSWPQKDVMRRIFVATNGMVTPNDFLGIVDGRLDMEDAA